MSGTRMVLLATALGACALRARAAAPGAGAAAKGAAKEAVRAHVEKTMGAFVAMDLAAFKAGLAEDVVAFEIDLENKPLRLGSRDEAVRFAVGIFAEMKKMGARMKLEIHSSECRAVSTLAYCTVEFDLKATMADGSTMSQPSRNSIVLRQGPGGWQWTHWHSSLAVAPAPHPAQ